MAGQIEELKARIKHVKELKNSYKLDDATYSTSNHRGLDPRLSALFAEQAHFVGIEGPRDDLVNWMLEEGNNSSKHRMVLSIVGFGGLGKTTLANEVYRSIKGNFDCRAFVSVSQKPDIKRIIKDVINQVSCKEEFTDGTTSDWDERKSITKLRELLQDKRIFGSIDHCPDMLKEVSEQILKKCGGLPLAIISLSGLLANKPTVKEEWEKVKRSIGSALEDSRSLEGMGSILSLSYNDLSPNLKTCLLYLSVFPEDYVIPRKRLVWQWIAEGFISEERGRSQYEVAEGYFYELINKSMIQGYDVGYIGVVRACRVHDMMLEILVSKSVEDNFVTVVGRGQMSLSSHHGIIRRLSIQHIDKDLAFSLAKEDLSHVRSLIVTASNCVKHLPSLSEFEALRVLDFEGCNGLEQYDMNSVEKLFQLKYLGLKDTGILKLPSRIIMLSDMETLDFRNTEVQELPAGFVHLTKLQNLLAGRQTRIPRGIGIMTNLQIIAHFNATMSPADALEELGNLTKLNGLSIYLGCQGSDKYKTHFENLFSSVQKLIFNYKLQTLKIYSNDSHTLELIDCWSPMPSGLQKFHMFTNYHFRNIPKWISPGLTCSLFSLDINLTEITEEGLHTLGELPSLLRLILTLETGEDKITVQGIGFRSLKYFEVSYDKGTYITFVKGAMPKLEFLDLELVVSVERNYGFYLGIVHLPCLTRVKRRIRSEGATKSEIIAARTAVKKEVDAHTNHPSMLILGGEEDTGKDGNKEEKSKEDSDAE